MNKYIYEFIGTFFLVFTIGLTVLSGASGVIPPLAIGAALMVMIFATGHVSGGHLNPAVTLGVLLRGRCTPLDAAGYWISQLLAGVVAALLVGLLRGGPEATAVAPAAVPVLLVEFLFTFALVFVVLNVATSKANANNSFYGLAIGMTVMVGAFSVGDISGGAFNPAVALGISIMGLSAWSAIWMFLVANLAGAVIAALVFKICNPGDE